MQRRLTFADVARYPRPGTAVPRHLTFTPDGTSVAFLYSPEGSLALELWTYDIEAGERRLVAGEPPGSAEPEQLTREEELRRQRTRQREGGVSTYQYVRDGESGPLTLLVPQGGALYVARDGGPLTRLAGTNGAQAARLSPDGSLAAFVRDGELHVIPTDGSAGPRQLTTGAGDGITNGEAEYIAQEEMDRHEGYWWSPDGASITYVRADNSHIPKLVITHEGSDEPSIEQHRYPFAGAANAQVSLGVIPAAGGEIVWMDLGPDRDIYLARVAWRPDGTLTAQVESRDQRTLRLLAFDARTGAAETLIEERGDLWLNLSDAWRLLKSGEIVWLSERSGFRHLYLYDRSGHEIRALTEGEWMVTELVMVDEERRTAYFHGTRDGVVERHLYAVPLDGGPIRRVTQGRGWHDTVVSPDGRLFVDTWSRLEEAPTVTLRRVEDGAEIAVLHADGQATASALGLLVPELVSFRNRDGVELHAAVYARADVRSSAERAPLIVAVYGGPSAQMVGNRWDLTVDMRAQYLAEHGFVVLKVDNRGSANRGLAFEAPLARAAGHVEVEDQVDGVRFLAARPYVDGRRVGIYGWSYGGYMTCMALMRAPDVFAVGVSGAPVTDWRGYDTHYTERYMSQPGANADGYTSSAVMTHVAALRGKLLLVHGMVDENVHFRHTARLIAALTAADKPYDLVVFPEERHMPRDAHGLEYLERRVIGYFESHL